MADKKTKEENVCGTKEGLRQEVGPVQISDQLSSAGENSRSGRPAIVRRGCFLKSVYPWFLCRNEDLKEMLESNKESLKLEAMKRIVGLIAKGKNASELFPAVVKNVASKNIELKKLVYVYLVRYAEEQQDLALLSISTFQRALKDPNQLIRASALRVLSSIRVPIIVPIMMLAIKEAATDLSPYVRKTAAHAIQKLFSLDPDQKEHLIEVIEKLLKDKSTLVAGSVVMAFEEVCPDRIDLIHKNYRKLCNLLVDVEEWGQVVIIHMLTRYARTQFVSPWREDAVFDENSEKAFYDSEEERRVDQSKPYIMDPDHRLLLRNTKPLLQSRNTAVVMAVSQLYWHLSPKHELSIITKSLVRLLRSHREVQYIVLQNIATMSIQRKGMFEPFMKSFYVRSTDATHIKTLKLEILTNLANEANISTILREFQTYVKSQDKAFAAATIQAIGCCATNISEVTDTCLNGLVLLLSNRDETVVAESVVVIKKLLQTQPSQHSDIIKHMAKLFDNITVRDGVIHINLTLDVFGEHCLFRWPRPSPMRRTLSNFRSSTLLDRTRFIRQLIVPNEKSGALSKYARRILMAPKPAPVLQSAFKDRDRFQLGTLSHTLNSQASGYLELSDWPAVAPDQSVRNVEVVEPQKNGNAVKVESRSESESGSESSSSESSSESRSELDSDSDSGTDQKKNTKPKPVQIRSTCLRIMQHNYSLNYYLPPQIIQKTLNIMTKYILIHIVLSISSPFFVNCMCSLLHLCVFLACQFDAVSWPVRVSLQASSPVFVPETSHELLHRMTGKGLSAQYRFTRQPCIYGNSMVSLQLTLSNRTDQALENIHISEKSSTGQNIHRFNAIERLEPQASVTVSMGVDFNDSTQTANFQLCTKEDEFSVSIQPAVGELLLPITMSEADFTKEQGKLVGMNESSATITITPENVSSQSVNRKVVSVANLGVIPSGQENIYRFAGKTVSSGSLVLVSVALKDPDAMITINTEKTVMGSMLLRQVKTALTNSGP
uniref:AP-3 complex subunit beta n=1 Tax=Sinocyclocheilus grahami TaxID=75366 RepID=A0A672K137_SINGR